jgi:ubiquinone/menaquinone biosynthesis C-methylase UbiE
MSVNTAIKQIETKADQFFEERVQEWEKHHSSPKDYWYRRNALGSHFLLKYLSGHLKCLEIGCAAGQFSELLCRQGHVVFGVDISSGMVEATRTRLRALGVPEVNFQSCAATSLPFDKESFDLVTALDVLPYIENQPAYLREVHRVLKPGGLAFLNNVNRASLHMTILLITRLPKAFGGRYLVHRSWFLGMCKGMCHGYSSGGFVDLSKAIQARSANMLDRFLVEAGFTVLDGYDMYNLCILDRNPLDRRKLASWAARRWAWNHFGLYRKESRSA